jgi:hypothetical protein
LNKYLSQEEIESLGWKLQDNGMYYKNNWVLKLWNDGTTSIIVKDLSKNNDSLIKNIMPSINFLSIKSIMELEVIMNQLNIK